LTLKDRVDLRVIIAGSHLSEDFGSSVAEVERDGVPVEARIMTLVEGGSDTSIASSIGLAVQGFAQELTRIRPDLLILFGDRHETFAAASASVPLRIPIAHIGGGENTVATTTDVIYRAAITKMSHLHFVATSDYRDEVLAMGEERWRVYVVGALGVDAIAGVRPISKDELFRELRLDPTRKLVVVTYHPVTMDPDHAGEEIATLLRALERSSDCQLVFTYPGADAGYPSIIAAVERFAEQQPRASVVKSLGSVRYLSLLRVADAMVGNSSSGVIEAPSLGLPVLNIGPRQDGRLHTENVLDVPCEESAIVLALQTVLEDKSFIARARATQSPFGDGRASQRIAEVLIHHPLDRLLRKETAARDQL
jgi:GDP/UDP-N,N'-diacetylbacillosamine 2-epimerase (hydrolysing)